MNIFLNNMIELIYYEDGLKKGTITDLDQLKNKPKWLDITNLTEDEKESIQKFFNLHPLTSEDLFNSNVRIKIEEFPEYLFFVFYGVRTSKSLELIELDFILGDDFLITSHKIEISSFQNLKSDDKRLEIIFAKGLDFLFHKLLDLEIDNFFPALENIDDMLEELEEEITKKPRPELLSEILKLKRKIVSIKRVALPQREKISFLAKNEYKFISKKSIPYFRDVYDHTIRVSDTIDNYREAIGSTFDAYMSAVSNNMNAVMKVLSIIATIALPLTVISGIYGTNFEYLPELHFKYSYFIFCGVMITLAVYMIIFFKKKGWL